MHRITSTLGILHTRGEHDSHEARHSAACAKRQSITRLAVLQARHDYYSAAIMCLSMSQVPN